MYYINMKETNKVETVDEFETLKEAKKNLKEYKIAFNRDDIYISTRSTREWKAK